LIFIRKKGGKKGGKKKKKGKGGEGGRGGGKWPAATRAFEVKVNT
jgi:hypothetical protein